MSLIIVACVSYADCVSATIDDSPPRIKFTSSVASSSNFSYAVFVSPAVTA